MHIIDQFAEVESGMKWALNKRLYFEIGIIRATQVLGEATLSDVILALRNSLDGSSFTPASAAAAPPETALPSMSAALRAAVESPPAKAPPPETKPAPAPPPAPSPATAEEIGTAAGPELWIAARDEFSRKYPLQGGYAAEAVFLGVSGRHFTIGVPEEHRMAALNLERPNTKTAMEEILAKLSGQNYSLKVEVSADIEPAPPPEVSTPVPPPAAPELPPEKASAKQPKSAAADEAAERAAKLDEEFRDDPLIQEALRLFDAKITQSA
jgi:DNA polymerase-3 subunit gamma/tau